MQEVYGFVLPVVVVPASHNLHPIVPVPVASCRADCKEDITKVDLLGITNANEKEGGTFTYNIKLSKTVAPTKDVKVSITTTHSDICTINKNYLIC